MIYVFHLLDDPARVGVRQQVRPAHKEYLGRMAERIAFAGPLLAADGETMIGSLLAIDFESREAAEQWLAGEPFTQAGLYANVQLHAYANLWPQRAGFAPEPGQPLK